MSIVPSLSFFFFLLRRSSSLLCLLLSLEHLPGLSHSVALFGSSVMAEDIPEIGKSVKKRKNLEAQAAAPRPLCRDDHPSHCLENVTGF